jgi:NADPH:quinone reductase-like Zn-dependent oxidoreductase
MRAAIRTAYGPPDVVHIAEVERPAPKDGEVLLRVRAAAVNPLDVFSLKGVPLVRAIPGLRARAVKILGCDVAGTIESVGARVTRFRPGDDVFGVTGFSGGGFAEYACAPEDALALKPANRSFEEAAAVPVAAITALQGLRDKGRIQRGDKVLIDGASGGVGTFAVQLAKVLGAHVTAVCSTSKVDTARSLGADHVIDYMREDFTTAGQRYDLILGVNAHHSIFGYRRALGRHGRFVLIGGDLVRILQTILLIPALSLAGGKKTSFFIAKVGHTDLAWLGELLEAGTIVPVIERCYRLRDVSHALRHVEEGHARGKVVITLGDDDSA